MRSQSLVRIVVLLLVACGGKTKMAASSGETSARETAAVAPTPADRGSSEDPRDAGVGHDADPRQTADAAPDVYEWYCLKDRKSSWTQCYSAFPEIKRSAEDSCNEAWEAYAKDKFSPYDYGACLPTHEVFCYAYVWKYEGNSQAMSCHMTKPGCEAERRKSLKDSSHGQVKACSRDGFMAPNPAE